jgi:peptide/nickel transport system permease protein
MLVYLLKRLLLILPTVWLISSLVFLFSRILPGTHADVAAEAQESTMGSGAKKITRTIYLAQLQQQGLDKPLFYFSVTDQAQPDTLYRVFPVQHQPLLQNLVNKYGNWPAIAAYYTTLGNLQTEIEKENYVGTNTILPVKINACLQASNNAKLAAILNTFVPDKSNILTVAARVKQRFNQMQQQAKPINLLLPGIRWHGSQNQYHIWFTSLFKGDLGRSYSDQQPVFKKIGGAFGNTLLMLTASLILTFLLSVELSLLLCHQKKGRGIILNILYVLDSIPLFLLALVLLTILLGTNLIDPAAVLGSSEDSIFSPQGRLAKMKSQLQHLWLPVLCLILVGIPYITTQLYQVLQQTLNAEYIKTARSKGLAESKVLRKHALRNALLPLITLFTGYLPVVISGAVVIEVIFLKPGSGTLLSNAMLARDYPVVIGLVLILAGLKAAAHVLADALYFAADPRTRSYPA